MGTKAHGRILFWEGASLWIMSAPPGEQYPRTEVHAHHVVQVTLALRGDVDLDGGGGVRVSGDAIAVAPDTPHSFAGTGLAAHLFVDPDGQEGRAIVRALFAAGPFATIPGGLLGELPARLRAAFEDPRHTDLQLTAIGRALTAALAGAADQVRGADPRIRRLIAWAAERLDRDPTLDEVARRIGLSPGRTRHLFVQQTGLPFKTWLLWQRLVRAVEIFAVGESLTDAAHGAGFADSAHLSRTFRRMFGIAAASLRLMPPARARAPA